MAPCIAAAATADAPSCHCFKDRAFDPARPAAADAYVLASARNSLLSAAFGVPKREIIQAEMTGTSPEELWIAHWAAARVGRTADEVAAARVRHGSWNLALFEDATQLPTAFNRALARGASDPELAAIATDDVLVARAGADAAALAAARAAGATTQEVVLAALLSPRIGLAPADVRGSVASGKKSWGVLLREAGVEPPQVDGLVRRLVH